MPKKSHAPIKLFVCGDSFCVDDPCHGDSWVNLLAKKLPHVQIVNLSSSGASNYLIYLQVKQALQEQCDYLIYHATSSIRQEFKIREDNHQGHDNALRYWNLQNDDKHAPLICGSWLGIDRHYHELLQPQQTHQINLFFKNFVDLPNLIEKNYIYIRHTLDMIKSSTTNWAWSRGGFEHAGFGSDRQWDFDQYQEHLCPINLWDYYVPQQIRPWFHVSDQSVQEKVCDQYIKMLNLINYR